jgi:DNA-binding CsgD family transcriptional regulator
MPASHVPPSAIASLSDKELEVLHLLAMGHTGKSIAARLGQSEASINERLRDARRKTGVGSSRELARIVDDQKIWDKNTDLSRSRTSTDDPAQPDDRSRTTSKGLIMIVVPIAIAAIAMAVANSPQNEQRSEIAQANAPDQLPLVGKWSLDV